MMTDRPLAEQVWHADIARLDGEFPALESITDGEVKTLARVARATPHAAGSGFGTRRPGYGGTGLRPEQDHALRVIVGELREHCI